MLLGQRVDGPAQTSSQAMIVTTYHWGPIHTGLVLTLYVEFLRLATLRMTLFAFNYPRLHQRFLKCTLKQLVFRYLQYNYAFRVSMTSKAESTNPQHQLSHTC